VRLRDEVEGALRAWNRLEIGRGAAAVVDFDCHPQSDDGQVASGRLAVWRQLTELREQAVAEGDGRLVRRVGAHLAYLEALLGVVVPVREYIEVTQGCGALGWDKEYVSAIGERARVALNDLGIGWGPRTDEELTHTEGELPQDEAAAAIQEEAKNLEPLVRAASGTSADFELSIETVDIPAYWAYWLDGSGKNVRLRINERNARFTPVQARQFALHEVLGHGLQCASFTHECATADVSWVRVTSVHAQQQVLLEGLAQAFPLFVMPDDAQLAARVRLAHYTQLVQAELHLAVNSGRSIQDCLDHAKRRVPFWDDERIADILTDRGADPLLRSYLWSYPAGIDWFVSLADRADPATIAAILQAAYREPLGPDDLAGMWADGPKPGGAAAPVKS